MTGWGIDRWAPAALQCQLVLATLGPLTTARGGAQPLPGTVTASFDSGRVAAEALDVR